MMELFIPPLVGVIAAMLAFVLTLMRQKQVRVEVEVDARD